MTMNEARDRKPELYGVSGWLLLLCIMLMVFLPIQLAIAVFITVGPATATVGLAVMIAVNAIGIVAGILLYREKRLGLLLAKIWCGLTIVFGLIAIIPDPIGIVGNSPVTFLRVVGGQAAWLIYLYRSERVRNTFSKDPLRDAAEVFR